MTPQQVTAKQSPSTGPVHCPSCTHNVNATIGQAGRRLFVQPGQKCPRCSSTLDAAYILRFDKAA